MKRILLAALSLALAGGLLPAAPAGKMIQIKGSDTMVNLVQILAEDYMGKTPGAAIAVLGGGSGTGITGLINRTCDIASHSREWKPKEIEQAWKKGVTPKLFVVAVDGLSIVVNEKNPIDQLTMAQVGALYRGEIKSWKALGGSPKPVSLYGRQSNSGTYVFMQEFVLGNKNYSADMKEMNGNAQIVEGILQDEGAVGYVGVGYLYDENHRIRKGLKVLKISREPNGDGFLPTDRAAVESGAYPVSRPLYLATDGRPKGDAARFLSWIVGPEGQAIVEREGFFTIGGGKYKASNDRNFQ
ncbi:MAG TPA: phosphate ABC transporter substrate-binding protein [Candidatus Aminicenantes bacterium]|nr:phosphate ABC transporter substrate-binding protein [Candidatus Aminicenantes bacterium]HRY65117.1 phosphate ABC transporter substrate-binding protein [Candidatus Aminicenantes bacterium]HRZ72415.1 phosphate ABC transporter substrate-binding protein [Candidatus Aminicenantes bacterium]